MSDTAHAASTVRVFLAAARACAEAGDVEAAWKSAEAADQWAVHACVVANGIQSDDEAALKAAGDAADAARADADAARAVAAAASMLTDRGSESSLSEFSDGCMPLG